MAEELDLYTGTLSYKDISFTFVFNKIELRLIPPEEKRRVIEWDWMMKEIRPGVSTFADPIPVEEPFLIGNCFETKSAIIFIPKRGSDLGLYNSVVRISLSAYIICKYDRDLIDRVSFSCPEINFIHPVNQAISYQLPTKDSQNTGEITVSTLDFDNTTTESQVFMVDGKEIKEYFGITRSVSSKNLEPPLRLDSSLVFEFEATNDYSFIFRLWWIARDFIRFLCYRRNILIPQVEISAPSKGGNHEKFATMYILDQDCEEETDILTEGRYIRQAYISGHEGKILSDIAQDNLYLRHLPDTYHSGRHINAARFVMITAAFEWEFRRLYPNGVKKSEATIAAEEAASERMQEHIDETSGRQKKIYKRLKKLVKSDSLKAEIVQMGTDFTGIIGVFGDHLYHLNGQELHYAEMGQRLSDQRNHFAHGDLDKDFIGLSLLDLIYMEIVVYAMQLKLYGIDDIDIQKAINDLFNLRIAIYFR